MATPKTMWAIVQREKELEEAYRQNVIPKEPFGKQMQFSSFDAEELVEEIDRLDEELTKNVTRKAFNDHRSLFALRRDYYYANKGRIALYTFGARTKRISKDMGRSVAILQAGAQDQ